MKLASGQANQTPPVAARWQGGLRGGFRPPVPLPQALGRCVRPAAAQQHAVCSTVTTQRNSDGWPQPGQPHPASPPPPPLPGPPRTGDLASGWVRAASSGPFVADACCCTGSEGGAPVGPRGVRWPCCPCCSARFRARVQAAPRGALSAAPVAAGPRTGVPRRWLLLGVGEERRVQQAPHPTPVSGALLGVCRNGPWSFAFQIILLGSRVQIPL